jgi:ABC-2 type transport system ATP-binding protein
VLSNNLQRASALAPIHTRDMLGQKVMIFENVPKKELKSIGELHAPSVADLFVAKMHC